MFNKISFEAKNMKECYKSYYIIKLNLSLFLVKIKGSQGRKKHTALHIITASTDSRRPPFRVLTDWMMRRVTIIFRSTFSSSF